MDSNEQPGRLRKLLSLFLMFSGGGSIIYGCIAFLLQVYGWLRTGVWGPTTMLNGRVALFKPGRLADSWLTNPTDWNGVHSILGWFPLSAGMILIGAALIIVGMSAAES